MIIIFAFSNSCIYNTEIEGVHGQRDKPMLLCPFHQSTKGGHGDIRSINLSQKRQGHMMGKRQSLQ